MAPRAISSRASWVLLGLGLIGGCADQPLESKEGLGVELASMAVVSGDRQTGKVGTQLPQPVVVKVTDAQGAPVRNQIVNFRVTAGGGSVWGGTALTDNAGQAQEWWTLGSRAGENVLEARAVDSSSGEKVVFSRFTATGVVGEVPVDSVPPQPQEPNEPDPTEPTEPTEPTPPSPAPPSWTTGSWILAIAYEQVELDLTANTISLPVDGTLNVIKSYSNGTLEVTFTLPTRGSASITLTHVNNEVRGTARAAGRTEEVTGWRPEAVPTQPEVPEAPTPPSQPAEPAPPATPSAPSAPTTGLHPNQPAGFTVITERAFDAEDEKGWSDGSAPATSGVEASFEIVNDPTAPQSASRVARVTFPTGLSGDGSSSRQIRSSYSVGTPNRLYMSFWFKVSDNWYGQDGSSVNKIFYVGHPLIIDAHGGGNSRLHLQLSLQGGEFFNGQWNATENEVQPTSAQAEIVRGRWHHIEVLVENNTPGQANGRLHAWVNGVKTHQFSGRRILSSGGDRYSEIGSLDWHPIYGGQNGRTVPATQYQYIDHLYVSRGQ